MDQIARRFSQRYPSIFDKNQLTKNLNLINTQSSSKDRSIDSAKSFLRGIFFEGTKIYKKLF